MTTPLVVRPVPDPRPPVTHLSREELLAEEEPQPWVQGALAVDFGPSPSLALAEDLAKQDFGFRRTATADLPDPRRWGAHIGQAIVEVVAGVRSPAQIVRWTAPDVHAQVARLGTLTARRSQRPGQAPRLRATVRTSRAYAVRDGLAEVALVVDDGRRVRALALELTGQDGRWRVTAWRMG